MFGISVSAIAASIRRVWQKPIKIKEKKQIQKPSKKPASIRRSQTERAMLLQKVLVQKDGNSSSSDCAICGASNVFQTFEEETFEKCSSCSCLTFQKGSLSKILKSSSDVLQTPNPPPSKVLCPKCGKHFRKVPFLRKPFVEVAQCSRCHQVLIPKGLHESLLKCLL